MERAYASSRSSLNLKRGRVVPTLFPELPRGQNLSDIPLPYTTFAESLFLLRYYKVPQRSQRNERSHWEYRRL